MGAHKDHALHAHMHRRREHTRRLETQRAEREREDQTIAAQLQDISAHIMYEFPATAQDLYDISNQLLQRHENEEK